MYLETSRRVDDLSRIAIPREIMESLNLETGDLINIRCINGEIILKKIEFDKDIEGEIKWKNMKY